MGKSKQDYISRVISDPDIPIFYQPWWLDILTGEDGWDAAVSYENEQITGIWPYTISRRFGQKVSLALPLTPFLGPHIYYPENQHKIATRYSFMEKSLNELVSQIQKEKFKLFSQYTAPDFHGGAILRWHNFSQDAMCRFVIRTLNDLDLTWQNFKSNTRNKIKKFNKTGSIIESYQPEVLYELIMASLNRSQGNPGFSKAMFLKITERLSKKADVKIYFAIDNHEKKVAGTLIVTSQDRAYLISTGMAEKQNGAVNALIWHGIQVAGKSVSSFDFCGSVIPDIYKFFLGFGGHLEPYYHVRAFSGRGIQLLYNLSGRR